MEKIEKLVQVHNTLCQIATVGEDTINMANCIVGIRDVIISLQKDGADGKGVQEDVQQ